MIRILKIQELKQGENIALESKMQQKFAAIGLAPKIFAYAETMYLGSRYGLIEMDLIDGVMDNILKENLSDDVLASIVSGVLDMLDELGNNNLVHGDMHWGNIGFNLLLNDQDNIAGIQLLFIDFGLACCPNANIDPDLELELVQLIRTLAPEFQEMPDKSRKYIFDRLYKVYKTMYAPAFGKQDMKSVLKQFDLYGEGLFDTYMYNVYNPAMIRAR